MNIRMRVYTKWSTNQNIFEEDRKPKCIFNKEIPIGFIPNKGDLICVIDGSSCETVTDVIKIYDPELSIEVTIDSYSHNNNYGPCVCGVCKVCNLEKGRVGYENQKS